MRAGFDTGGTQIKYGLVDEEGSVLFESQVDTPKTAEALIQVLSSLWESLKKRAPGEIATAGFGFPGIFSQKEQRILQSPNFPDLDGFALVPALSRFMDVPFCLNNDANMAAYGEYRQGAGQRAHSLVLLTIGTGVGTGIILEGKIWQGACGFAGELGHAPVNPDGDPCDCTSRGCLETEVSAPKIVRNYLSLTPHQGPITAEEVCQKARNHDEAAVRAFAQAGRYLGIGLAIAINLLNPEKILLGGGVIEAEEFLLPPALKEASRRSFQISFACCRIEKAALGNRAGFIGAALWSREQSFKL